jgi:hypothetical protein
MYKSEAISLRLSPQELETIDLHRGSLASRSAYIRHVLAEYHRNIDVMTTPLTPETVRHLAIVEEHQTDWDTPPVESPLTEQMPTVPTITDHAYPGEPRMIDDPNRAVEVQTVSTNTHRHKRGEIVQEWKAAGRTKRAYQCTGCPMLLRDE